ncbi:hypothetical protein BC936DRAFT_141841 [Jimgerdemannia flammicorona]|uniref:Uncharacterized protein n=1 Tax=Jimgerdemannia flammicorona TaxID=994334 RepID=A0A433DFS5_9FUNG|nr:hypothetical protein BC936DRAFT_141841 [Jimgerdemannia flammicorona]
MTDTVRILKDIVAGLPQTDGVMSAHLNPVEQVLCVDNVVNPTSLQAHLALLRWLDGLEIPDKMLDTIYLVKAELRYLHWLNYLNQRKPTQQEMIVPPIDVACIWHAHLLSPYRYYEDLLRLYPTSEHMLDYVFPLEKLHKVIASGYQIDLPSEITWLEYTGNEPYVLALNDITTRLVAFSCPWCSKQSEIQWETWARVKTQKGLSFRCQHCTAKCNADTLSGRRFLDDVALYRRDRTRFLAGGIITTRKGTYEEDKIMVEHQMLLLDHEAKWHSQLANGKSWQNCEWKKIVPTLKAVVKELKQERKDTKFRKLTVGRIRGSYMGLITPFSIDLVAAVVRQRDFSSKIIGVNIDSQEGLAASVRRYFMFLMLMKKYWYSNESFIPTLDIDLAWHTHMLFAPRYRAYTTAALSRVTNHDDTIKKGKLDGSLVKTSLKWYQLYKEPYTSENLVQRYLILWRIFFAIIMPLYGIWVIYMVIKLRKASRRPALNEKTGSACGAGAGDMAYTIYIVDTGNGYCDGGGCSSVTKAGLCEADTAGDHGH